MQQLGGRGRGDPDLLVRVELSHQALGHQRHHIRGRALARGSLELDEDRCV